MEDAIEELYNKFILKNNNNKKNNNITKEDNLCIEKKGNTLKYNNRLFKLNNNANKYNGKVKRFIYFCQYYYKQLQNRKKENIGYCPDKEPDEQFKISGEHSAECIELYNDNTPKKKKF